MLGLGNAIQVLGTEQPEEEVYTSSTGDFIVQDIFNPEPLYVDAAPSSKSHSQLTDNAVYSKGHVYVNNRTSVVKYNTETQIKEEIVCTLDDPEEAVKRNVGPSPYRKEDLMEGRHFRWGWNVVCMTIIYDKYLIVGGQYEGMLIIIDLEDNNKILKLCSLGGSMTNIIRLHEHPTGPRLIIMNNSSPTFHVYTFPQMQTVTKKYIPSAQSSTLAGGVAISPDQQWLVTATDRAVVYVYYIGTHLKLPNSDKFFDEDKGYKLVVAKPCLFPGYNNSVAFSPNSDEFALASESGTCYIYKIKTNLNDNEEGDELYSEDIKSGNPNTLPYQTPGSFNFVHRSHYLRRPIQTLSALEEQLNVKSSSDSEKKEIKKYKLPFKITLKTVIYDNDRINPKDIDDSITQDPIPRPLSSRNTNSSALCKYTLINNKPILLWCQTRRYIHIINTQDRLKQIISLPDIIPDESSKKLAEEQTKIEQSYSSQYFGYATLNLHQEDVTPEINGACFSSDGRFLFISTNVSLFWGSPSCSSGNIVKYKFNKVDDLKDLSIDFIQKNYQFYVKNKINLNEKLHDFLVNKIMEGVETGSDIEEKKKLLQDLEIERTNRLNEKIKHDQLEREAAMQRSRKAMQERMFKENEMRNKQKCRKCSKLISGDYLIHCLRFSYPWNILCDGCYVSQVDRKREDVNINNNNKKDKGKEKIDEDLENKFDKNNFWKLPLAQLDEEDAAFFDEMERDKERDIENRKQQYISQYVYATPTTAYAYSHPTFEY